MAPTVLSSGIAHSTLAGPLPCNRYNGVMWFRRLLSGVCVQTSFILPACVLSGFLLFFFSGCESHPLTDYRPLSKAGMDSSYLEQLKSLNSNDAEVAQVLKMKQGAVKDDMNVALVSSAHAHHHVFNSADS